MNQLIEAIFKDEITKQGLAILQEQYPANLKLDMSDDATFKAARKTRTEMNKLIGAIKRRRVDISGELKTYADEVTAEILRIYDVVVIPFLTEDKLRKDEEIKKQKERDELLVTESKKINEIATFVDDCRGKDSDHIQGIIEAVDLIETDVFDKELIHQAIEVKKTTLAGLAQLLTDTIASEKVEVEREVLRKQQAEADEKQRQAERAQKITDRINELKMIPSELFGQTSGQIQYKIKSLVSFEITEQDFDDNVDIVIQHKMNVVNALNQMLEQQLKIEAVESAEAEKLEAEQEQKAKDLEEANQITRQAMANQADQEPEEEKTIQDEPKETLEQPDVTDASKDIQFQDSTPKQRYLMDDLAEFCNRYQLPEIATQELFELIKIYQPMTLLNADGSRSVFDDVDQ